MVDMSGSGPIARVRTGGLLAAVAIVAVIAVVLTGCGGSAESLASKPAAEILATSRTAALNATAVHVASQAFASTGNVRSKVRKLKPISTSDLQLTTGGGRARVVLLGSESEAIRVGDTLYLKSSPAFYRRLAQRTGVHVAPGTWLKTPAHGAQLTGFAALTEPSSELDLLLSDAAVSLTKGPITSINGQKAIELKTKERFYTGAIYIAATGKPYPLEIVKHGREAGQTTFTGWNQPVTLSAPAGAVELSQLEHKAR